MIKHAGNYRWSSYCQYISMYQDLNTNIDAKLIRAYLSKQEDFEEYMNALNDDECLELKPVKKYADVVLKKILLCRVR